MRVSDFAKYAERISSTSSRIEKQDIVWEALQEVDNIAAEDAILAFTTNQRFEDSGVAKKTIRNAFSSQNIRELESEHGDLPSAMEKVFEDQSGLTQRSDVPIERIFQDMEIVEGLTKGSKIKSHVQRMLTEYKEPKWVTHALLADDGVSMGFGVKSGAKMIRRYHDSISKEDMEKARALCPDIIELNRKAPDVPLTPEVGTAFKPMLADDEGIPEEPGDEWFIQPKYDGARVLVHYDQGDVSVFSRRVNEVTESLPEVRQVTDLLPDDGRYILDGEAIAYKDGERQSFQKIMTRFNREKNIEEQEIDVGFTFFDLLYAEDDTFVDTWGGDLSGDTNHYRVRTLRNLFAKATMDMHDLYVAPLTMVYSRHEAQAQYQQYVADGYEGAIIKQKGVSYEYDKRSKGWQKAKDMKDNADLIIDEIIEGEDSRAGKMGAIRLRTSDGVTVGKVGTGFTEADEEWFWENREELLGRVMEVEWQEIQQKEDGTWGLRFPVYVAVREKDEADSLDWLKEQ